MDDLSRRGFLRNGVLATSGIALAGKASASGSSNLSLRLRRNLDDPITPNEIKSKKNRILKEVPEARSGDGTPQRSKADLADNEYIVGYNLDVINGVPREWVGVYEKSTSGHINSRSAQQGHTPSHATARIHNKADQAAAIRGEK